MSGLHLHIDCRIEIKLNHHKKQSQTGETVSRHVKVIFLIHFGL